RVADGERRNLRDAPPADENEAGFPSEPRALADGAARFRHQSFDLVPDPGCPRLALAPLEQRDDARERPPRATAAPARHADLLVARAVEQRLLRRLGKLGERRVTRKPVVSGQSREALVQTWQDPQHDGRQRPRKRLARLAYHQR